MGAERSDVALDLGAGDVGGAADFYDAKVAGLHQRIGGGSWHVAELLQAVWGEAVDELFHWSLRGGPAEAVLDVDRYQLFINNVLMQGPKPPAFRPMLSLWPGEARELPAVVIVPIVERGGLVEWSSSARPSRVALPDDFVIREVVEAEDAVTFMRDWGLLVRAQDELRSLPEDDRPALPTVAGGGGSLRAPASISLLAAEHHLRVLRALARHYLADAEGDEAGVVKAWTVEGFPAVSDSWTPWYWWTNHINAALRAFPMYVDFTRPDEEVHLLQTPSPTTYEIAALQLAQMATGGREVLRCANERCRRSFTRQRSSRRQYRGTEHATGLKYCSRECAKAQSERDRRARRREQGRTET